MKRNKIKNVKFGPMVEIRASSVSGEYIIRYVYGTRGLFIEQTLKSNGSTFNIDEIKEFRKKLRKMTPEELYNIYCNTTGSFALLDEIKKESLNNRGVNPHYLPSVFEFEK